ncbi:cytochrome c biogenesis CcdA family protein [Haloglycomyces albus]|uniref:cytochrome c biogenesis CcdA family protein n=1 Tax=Haloglycomyces albus TaxID=526067 RepID=UPI0006861B3F|nr:cytochrome c biogenesis protein CcdA [Haloglycomyces albus]
MTVVVGIAVVGAGLWMLSGRELSGFVPRLGGREIKRSVGSMFVFGFVFALASLSCTIAPFLAVVAQTFRQTSVLGGTLVFLTYALGMSLVIGIVSITIALAREGLVHWLRRHTATIMRFVGVLLIIAGLYVAYYGWWEIQTLNEVGSDDPIIEAAASIQQWLAEQVNRLLGN